MILTDTAGFIRQLPKELVEAFRSTFEETLEANLILHVADAGDPELDTHLREVEKTLQFLKADHIPKLLVFNKIDTVDPLEWDSLSQKYSAILCSAVTGNGLPALMQEIEQQLFHQKNQDP